MNYALSKTKMREKNIYLKKKVIQLLHNLTIMTFLVKNLSRILNRQENFHVELLSFVKILPFKKEFAIT